jgi:hypothetical protein
MVGGNAIGAVANSTGILAAGPSQERFFGLPCLPSCSSPKLDASKLRTISESAFDNAVQFGKLNHWKATIAKRETGGI